MLWSSKQKSFFDYFEEMAMEIHTCSELLNELFNTKGHHQEIAKKIKFREHAADQIVHQAFNQLNTSSFILPIDREDIINFLKNLDDTIDIIDDSAEAFCEIFELNDATQYAKKLSKEIVEGAITLRHTCSLIRKPSKYAKVILKNCQIIHELENSADDIKKDALHSLYIDLKTEKITPAFYLAWSEIYHKLESITDKIENCANVSEQFVMKYS